MTVFRLDPFPHRLTDPRWQASTVTELIFVGATTDQEARALAAQRTLTAAVGLQSPWLDDHLTSCVIETSKTDVPVGTVITADGQLIGDGS
jgi:hypothetical protein